MSLLEINNIDVFYGQVQVLHDLSLSIDDDEIVVIVGANSAGKSTLIRTISGQNPVAAGHIRFGGQAIENRPSHEIVEAGIVQIPEGRRLFPFMTVEENLMLGAYNSRAMPELKQTLQEVLELFPRLAERRHQLARTMSGGEQQMVAIARGLMAKPKLLMFDEPSLGLAPLLVKEVFNIIPKVREQKIPVLLVEQNVKQSLALCDRGYVLENGRMVIQGSGEELLRNKDIKKAYLGA
ncbi:ABC transporter ATP-binding protein [Desulfosarcina ovata subsp. sediminis]|uniref:ABC transporter ATP-binding protein n=1 Tax=Desulfosarcina ovata subsp. sediminis TaxID=885957 RepID=A0A5K7ZN01_9BACT|nr:ABC transporter ATP-binding protein [Desulfosarcina ovata]BBO79900.1 ABC transporter ATP-binding protein [Desulfosarcina ovata subsp. sediminis]